VFRFLTIFVRKAGLVCCSGESAASGPL